MSDALPSNAQAVIIGGGIMGVSVAYHLAKLGWRDVVLLERDRLTAGTTWHAAGLIASGGITDETGLWAERYSRQLYIDLEAETGMATGWRQCGYMQVASTDVRRDVLRREARFARTQGLEKHELSPREIKDRFPLLEVDDLILGLYTPTDGRVNPVDVTMALASAARRAGVRIIERVTVTDILTHAHKVTGVSTSLGDIQADTVVLATGMWSRQIGRRLGVSIPLQAAEHYYLLTERIAAVGPMWPVVEDPDSYAYIREEGGGLLFGLFEPDGACWNLAEIPADGSFLELPPDWERMTPFLAKAFRRLPLMNTVGIRKLFCGPESFTPDGRFLIGETPEIDRLFVATGMNSLGILSGGGMGALLAEWIATGSPSHDVSGIMLARTLPHQSTRHFLGARIPELLGYTFNHAQLPEYKHGSARNVRRLALHDRYVALGASFMPVSDWEVPRWFSQDGKQAAVDYNFERQAWFDYNAIEHGAVREQLGIFDKAFMAKFIVQGRDAEAVLNHVSANSVPALSHRIVYTQWLNERGGIVSDLMILRLGETRFLLLAPDLLQRFTPHWLRRHGAADADCTVSDVSSAYTVFALQGPASRKFLAGLCGEDLSNDRMPFRSAREIEVGPSRVLAVRISYVGELGYELYVPTEFSHAVHDALLAHAATSGTRLVHCGLVTLDSLRLEKGYRDYGVDIDNSDTPLDAGLSFAVDFRKSGFVGREALLRQRESGLRNRQLVQFQLKAAHPRLFGHEPIICDGLDCGYLRSAGYGHTLGGAVGLGMVEHPAGVTAELLLNASFEIETLDGRIPAMASLTALYDPLNERLRS